MCDDDSIAMMIFPHQFRCIGWNPETKPNLYNKWNGLHGARRCNNDNGARLNLLHLILIIRNVRTFLFDVMAIVFLSYHSPTEKSELLSKNVFLHQTFMMDGWMIGVSLVSTLNMCNFISLCNSISLQQFRLNFKCLMFSHTQQIQHFSRIQNKTHENRIFRSMTRYERDYFIWNFDVSITK